MCKNVHVHLQYIKNGHEYIYNYIFVSRLNSSLVTVNIVLSLLYRGNLGLPLKGNWGTHISVTGWSGLWTYRYVVNSMVQGVSPETTRSLKKDCFLACDCCRQKQWLMYGECAHHTQWDDCKDEEFLATHSCTLLITSYVCSSGSNLRNRIMKWVNKNFHAL